MSILRDYIAYAREHIHPKLSELASQRLIQAYVDMRKVGSGRGHITAYPRQLESLIRLSEAHAKLRFSEMVQVTDVEEAWRWGSKLRLLQLLQLTLLHALSYGESGRNVVIMA